MILHTNLPRSQRKTFLQSEAPSILDVSALYIKPPHPPSITPSKKSRRTSRKQAREVLKWSAKQAKQDWKYLAKQPAWQLLSKDQKFLLMLGWPDRHFCLSYEEIADALDISIDAAKRLIKKWVEKKKLRKKKNYLKRHGKQTGIHRRNHYTCTKQCKKEIAELVKMLFSEPEKTAPRKDSNKLENYSQANSALSPYKKVFEGGDEDYHKFLEERLAQLEEAEEPLKPAVATIFELHGFKSQIPSLCSWLKKEINRRPIKQIVKILKWIEAKRKKNFRIRNFWSFFVWVMKNKIPKPWMTKRADDYKKAIQKETTIEGVDSQIVVEQIIKLQERTGKVATKKDLRGLLCYGASHLSSFLKVVNFKLNRSPVRNWIGYAHFLSKKSVTQLANMYKSEKKIQAEKEKEDAFLKSQRNQREACSWDQVLRDLEEGDRLVAVGESPEMWD